VDRPYCILDEIWFAGLVLEWCWRDGEHAGANIGAKILSNLIKGKCRSTAFLYFPLPSKLLYVHMRGGWEKEFSLRLSRCSRGAGQEPRIHVSSFELTQHWVKLLSRLFRNTIC
jgi:hypothetical protein